MTPLSFYLSLCVLATHSNTALSLHWLWMHGDVGEERELYDAFWCDQRMVWFWNLELWRGTDLVGGECGGIIRGEEWERGSVCKMVGATRIELCHSLIFAKSYSFNQILHSAFGILQTPKLHENCSYENGGQVGIGWHMLCFCYSIINWCAINGILMARISSFYRTHVYHLLYLICIPKIFMMAFVLQGIRF